MHLPLLLMLEEEFQPYKMTSIIITKDPQLPAFLYVPKFRATLSILFINLGCQVVLHVSHISNLVLNN